MPMRPIFWSALVYLGTTAALWGMATIPSKAAPSEPPRISTAPPDHWNVLHKYCVTCHNTEDWAGGLALDALSAAQIPEDTQTWEKVVRKLRSGMMPPAGKPRPARPVLESFATELSSRLDQAQALHPVTADVSVHRLNRTEYANAIRDLLSFDVDVTTLLPADDAAEGFDNMADILNVSPTLVQGYISAAMKISRWTVGDT